MLVKRTLNINSQLTAETLLRREDIADAQRASEVLDHALLQAARIRAQATEDTQRHIERALGEFWNRANQLLLSLAREREVVQERAVATLDRLLNGALMRLLDEVGLEERIRVILRDLSGSQSVGTSARLSCHPDMLATVEAWLADSRFVELWQLQADEHMSSQCLRLSDASGAFDVDWAGLRAGLLGLTASQSQ